jgi:hypothetical protein
VVRLNVVQLDLTVKKRMKSWSLAMYYFRCKFDEAKLDTVKLLIELSEGVLLEPEYGAIEKRTLNKPAYKKDAAKESILAVLAGNQTRRFSYMDFEEYLPQHNPGTIKKAITELVEEGYAFKPHKSLIQYKQIDELIDGSDTHTDYSNKSE